MAQSGEEGESVILLLELKLLADVGLLAKPNAGKSTLLSRCSAAKPKIADYPFTTVEPALGVVTAKGQDFVMMEVPGLIEGAHDGVGLGDEFLRHAERARLYIHLIDGMAPDPVGDYRMINQELQMFNPDLVRKPQVIAVTKMDVTEVSEKREELRFVLEDELVDSFGKKPDIFFISSVSGEGVDYLLGYVVDALATAPETPFDVPEPVAVSNRRGTRGNSFYLDNGVYVVESEQLERLTALADTRDYRVLLQIWREMTRLGIARGLSDAGIEAGDTIRIGNAEMEWF